MEEVPTNLTREQVNGAALVMMGLKSHKGNIPLTYAAELGYGQIVDMLLALEIKKEHVNS